jgi:phosphoglycolate phosphatase (TIGR01487 family)
MRYLVLATDYDGTIAHHGAIAPPTIDALRRLQASGRHVVLVTGRELDELIPLVPCMDVFSRVVAENGALLFDPRTGHRKALGEPPPEAFVRELERRGVTPLSVGKSVVATFEPHETTVLATIRDLGLELKVIFNKGAVMVLPSDVNKATGLAVALAELGVTRREVVAVGDAENDHALFEFAAYAAAVDNAIPALKERADLVLPHPHGEGVVTLVDAMLADDLASSPPAKPRA